ncbi:type I-E CRISPR-associated protein Cas5/CasD [Kutzneria sp. NPDC052558]|uniref:type I-E CRISPR-associated protein Cas5/CasD n=1 Tax=Kutzneria sp. NPDC052558 TaxID=3364121 RepID=UPI0037C712CF
MTALLLRLAAPLQSWGTSSRFVRRSTDRTPSKSGVIGLLAAAQGRRRTDPIEDLVDLRIGVRVEQPGRIERDFQTALSLDGGTALPLSYRMYLADAVFLVAVEGEQSVLEGLRDAVRRPQFPLFLGRRSCPPAGKVEHGLRDGTIEEVLGTEPWHASPWVMKSCTTPTTRLDAVFDVEPATTTDDLVRDVPLSFDPRRREHTWRSVLRDRLDVPNPEYRAPAPVSPDRGNGLHDPWAAFGDDD